MFPSWNPTGNTISEDSDVVLDHSYCLKIYTCEDVISATKNIISYISDIFHVKMKHFSFDYRNLSIEKSQLVMDSFFQQPIQRFKLSEQNTIDAFKSDALTYILQSQKTTSFFDLYENPSPGFTCDFEQMETVPELMDFSYSHWTTFQQILKLKNENLWFSRSNFLQTDFEILIMKWRGGWTPNWKALLIEFNEDVNIDTCVKGDFIQLPSNSDCWNKTQVYRNFPIELNRFIMRYKTAKEPINFIGYHILRSDGRIATIAVDNNKIGWFQIQSDDKDEQMVLSFHPRVFDLV
ncbi:hypothetical protein GCK72_020440 [Caenorhabditis remanei]|uniref:F-box associated domain-containing protein n=1 Tax=Caenorhabditis remanei TaxID=31234 RepID=A0A6A5GGT1_CAERE|nr:hypothetical protein GCK72_020440 [Caenorhabditis remanei]KAF1753883.1 hypothetical protein GCK72_020440 [Caenorhabditis remanei]